MINGLLPIGSVVLLTNSTKRLMIIGVCQKEQDQIGKLWDYAGCVYPEGYLGASKTYLFNQDQIERLYALGYQDEEQFAFKTRADDTLAKLREQDAR